jgi:U4/U6.U5 tri-snRNP-associated protein 3
MAAMMGFAGFGTTKGTHVTGNAAASAVAKAEKRVEYRQYMNRKGGFNRPLDDKSAV